MISAVSSIPGSISLFIVDAEGAVQTCYFDPRVVTPQWSPWARLSEPGLAPGGADISAISSIPGGISLFVVDHDGGVQTSYYDPRVATPQWSPWFPLSGPGLTPAGAVVSAVSSVEGGISLFVVNLQGAVQSSYFDPHVANPQWSPWFPLSDPGKTTVGTAVSAIQQHTGRG